MPTEVGHDPAGVHRERQHAVDALSQCHGMERVGRLRPAVGDPGVVVGPLEVGVVEVDVGDAVRCRRQHHDARIVACLHGRGQQAGQFEVAEVIRAELHLEAVGGAAERAGHDAGVVHQHVDCVARIEVAGSERAHAGQVGEVEGGERQHRIRYGGANALSGVGVLLWVTRQHQHRGAVRGERTRRFLAEPAGCAGDHESATGQVDAVEHVVGGGFEGEGHAPTVGRAPAAAGTRPGSAPVFRDRFVRAKQQRNSSERLRKQSPEQQRTHIGAPYLAPRPLRD